MIPLRPEVQRLNEAGFKAAKKMAAAKKLMAFKFPIRGTSRLDATLNNPSTDDIVGMVEIKTRTFDEDTFLRWRKELRVGMDKWAASYRNACAHQVPHYYMAFFEPSNVVYLQQVFAVDVTGEYSKPLLRTKTRMTNEWSDTSYKSAERRVESFVYIDMSEAERFDLNNPEELFDSHSWV